jgi:hypothetical protein
MERKRIDPAAAILLVAIAFYGFLQYQYALYGMYIWDEFVDSAMGADMFLRARPYVDYFPFKTQLGILLYGLPYTFCRNMEVILLINRHTAFLFVVLSLYVLYQLQREIFGSERGGLWAVLWTLTCSTFLEHSFTIRVDIMATFMAILAVRLFVARQTWRSSLAAGMCLSLAFCMTQKAGYFILAFILAFWLAQRKADFNPIKEFGAFALGGVVVFAAYVVGFGHGGVYASVVKDVFNFKTAASVSVLSPYTYFRNYYWQTFSRNIPFYCLSFVGLAYVFRFWRASTWQRNFSASFTLIVLVFLLIHRHSWPYLFMFVIPFLACFAAFVSEQVYDALRNSTRVLAVPALVLLAIVAITSVMRYQVYFRYQSFAQMETVRAVESILGPEDTYYDGTRMIGTRKSARNDYLATEDIKRLLASWDTLGAELMDALRAAQCKVIIYNSRLTRLPEQFQQFIQDHYVLADKNIFVSGSEITTSPQEVELIWGGPYGVVIEGNCKNLRVDGEPLAEGRGRGVLRPGKHRVTYEGDGAFLLIPEAARQWMEKNRVERTITSLFVDLYGV